MQHHALLPHHIPSPLLPPGGNFTYIFRLSPAAYNERSSIHMAQYVIDLPGSVVKAATPNFTNVGMRKHRPGSPAQLGVNQGVFQCQTNDPEYPELWHIENNGTLTGPTGGQAIPDADAQICECWQNHGFTGHDIKIAVIGGDTIDHNHPDVAPRILNGYDCTGNACNTMIAGTPQSSSDAITMHVSGIIAGAKNNGQGIAGIAPGAKILPFKVAPPQSPPGPHPSTTWDAVIKALERALLDNVDIVVLAFWEDVDSIPGPLDFQIKQLADLGRNGKGCLIICPGGGFYGAQYPAPIYPASHPDVLSVTISTPADSLDTAGDGWEITWPDYGANFASAQDTFDIAAPGWLLQSTDIGGAGGESLGDYYQEWNFEYGPLGVVAGIAALMLEKNEDLTQWEIRKLMQENARKPHYQYNPASGKSHALGHGVVDCNATMSAFPTAMPSSADLQSRIAIENPVSDILKLKFDLPPNRRYVYRIMDLKGRTLNTNRLTGHQGNQLINVSGMHAGIYCISVSDRSSELQSTIRFIKFDTQ